MINNFEDINKIAYEYAVKTGQFLSIFRSPLKQFLDVDGFVYFKVIINTNNYLFLCCGSPGIEVLHKEYFFDTELQNMIANEYTPFLQTLCLQKKLFNIYPNEDNDTTLLRILRAHKIMHLCSINFKEVNYIESFCFLIQESTQHYIELFLERMPVLSKFVDHLKSNYGEILYSTQHKFAKQCWSLNCNLNDQQMIELESRKKFFNYIAQANAKVERLGALSTREHQCLELILKGRTAKEIATILNISVRTVEIHMRNLKLKTGCRHKSELIQNFFDVDLL